MPIRFGLPLPGPFFLVGKSRMEKDYERARRAEHIASLSQAQKFRRGFALAVLIWLVILSACSQAGPGWVLVAAVLAGVNLSMGVRNERRRRQAEMADLEAQGE